MLENLQIKVQKIGETFTATCEELQQSASAKNPLFALQALTNLLIRGYHEEQRKRPLPDKLEGTMQIRYSRDRSLYYLPEWADLGRFWLSTETIPGEPTEEQKQSKWEGFLEIRPDQGEVYTRKMLSFMIFDVKSGDTEEIEANSDLVKDFLSGVSIYRERWER